MNRKKIVIPLVALAASAVLVVSGIFTYRAVYAQSSTSTPDSGSSMQDLAPGPGHPGGPMGDMPGGVSDQQLADALGITLDQLQAAYTTADTNALNEAVSQGLITQDQADQIQANGKFPGHFNRFGQAIDYNALLADALGISTDQLQSARTQALSSSLDSAVQAGTITQDQADMIMARNALGNDANFQSSLQTAYQDALNQAVSNGVITQSQADLLASNSPNIFAGHGFGGGRGDFGGGPFPGGRPDQSSAATPSN
jgi:ribosomal protein S20